MSFWITGHGRCGTKFLAETFNKTGAWTVVHEPTNWSKYVRGNCGFVCSISRWDWDNIVPLVDNHAIVLRNPLMFLISQANRTKFDARWKRALEVFGPTLELLDHRIEEGAYWVSFFDLVTSPSRVVEFAYEMGVENLKLTDVVLADKVNAGGKAISADEVLSRKDLPRNFEWFAQKYELVDERSCPVI